MPLELPVETVAQEVAARRQRLAAVMQDHHVDAVVIASESNFTYLTGYTTGSWANKTFPLFLVFLPDERPIAVVGAGEVDSIALDGVDLAVASYSQPGPVDGLERAELDFVPDAGGQIGAMLRERGVRRLGIERSLPYGPRLAGVVVDRIAAELDPLELVDVAPAMSTFRRRKSSFEIGRMRDAAEVLGRAYSLFEERMHLGMTERELRRVFTSCGAEAGADRVGYVGAIADARRASLGGPTDRRFERGQLLMFDACIEVDGYWADFCRIYAGAVASPDQLAAYATLVDVLAGAQVGIRPGLPIADIARRLVDDSGGPASIYGRSGHGIGLDYTEPPSMHLQEPARAEPGMTLCLEPNRSIAGVGNLTAEEEVLITEHGCERISPPFPATMPIID
jgi:Xaa-Pro aminopeptidase